MALSRPGNGTISTFLTCAPKAAFASPVEVVLAFPSPKGQAWLRFLGAGVLLSSTVMESIPWL